MKNRWDLPVRILRFATLFLFASLPGMAGAATGDAVISSHTAEAEGSCTT